MRVEPPVSVPIAISHIPSAAATALVDAVVRASAPRQAQRLEAVREAAAKLG